MPALRPCRCGPTGVDRRPAGPRWGGRGRARDDRRRWLGMIERLTVRSGAYRDSVTLMLASQDAGAIAGVVHASAVSATPLNLELLELAGFGPGELEALEPTDLVVAVRAEDESAAAAALEAIEVRFAAHETTEPAGLPPPRSLTAAVRRRPDASLAVISVPGEDAAHECSVAIEAGLHAFCFSSGFDVSVEAALKRRAVERGLLLMGPDCGTAILDGIGIGFANEVRPGPVGIVGASGTGIQEVACLLDIAGVGISQAIGVGGRDLGAEVGATMSLRAIELLAGDGATEVIVVIAKSPEPGAAGSVAAAAAATGKPAILCFPGLGDLVPGEDVEVVATLEEAARRAAIRSGASLHPPLVNAPATRPGLIRGLFSGGTLRDEAFALLASALAEAGEAPPLALGREPRPEEEGRHLLIDYGSEALTRGRAHPMIDPTLRAAALERAGARGEISVLIVDVVLGRAAHDDPAAVLAPAISRMLSARPGELAVVVSLCGAARDPQGLDEQAARLADAGAVVVRGNAQATRLAIAAAAGTTGEPASA
ncbi:MAG: hypothetical protein GEU88_00865 [Solirubrobacterales bacterium]|nr:hypothetical protein [Solirubrobacterales bacterium]